MSGLIMVASYFAVGLFTGRKAYHQWWRGADSYDRNDHLVQTFVFAVGVLFWPFYMLWRALRKPVKAFLKPPEEREREEKEAQKKKDDERCAAAYAAVKESLRLRDEATDESVRKAFQDLADTQLEYAKTLGPDPTGTFSARWPYNRYGERG